MISLKVLAPGSDPARYYLSRQANCSADYYLGAEPTGRWVGSGSLTAGLSGPLDGAGEERLRALLEGKVPDGSEGISPVLRADPRGRLDAAPLVAAVSALAVAQDVPVSSLFAGPDDRVRYRRLAESVERGEGHRVASMAPKDAARLAAAVGLDVRTVYRGEDGVDRYEIAQRHARRRIDIRRPGIDVTVSAPKSVSVLFGLGNPAVAAMVRDAHQAAIGEALAYLESVAGHGLRGHQGHGQRADRIATDGWIVAAFEHHTSRAGDPQLHTHLVVPNLLHGVDGKWSAIDSRAVHRHALTASYLYQAVLRGQLTERLGVAWTPPEKGVAELAGVPEDLIATFSTRRHQILTALKKAGDAGPAAAQAACLATRPAKPTAESEPTLREQWAATVRAAGHDPWRVVSAVLGRGRAPVAPSMDRLTADLLGPAGLTAQATGFDRRDLLQALCQALPPGLQVDRVAIERAADQVLASRDAVRLATGKENGPRWSTTELIGVEQVALWIADELRPAGRPPLTTDMASVLPADQHLSDGQVGMVRALAAASGLAVVVGPAGAGKTAALAVAARVWEAQGRPVLGGAVAAVTARRLEHATGVASSSLTRLLAEARRCDPATGREVGLPAGGVLVVDEASMVDTRTLAGLLARTRAAAGTLVLVGDPAQLPEIGAGGLFIALARHPETITLTDNRRQNEAWERRALADLRAGDPDAALSAYAAHGRVHAAPEDELVSRVVADYLRHTGHSEPGDRGALDTVAERVVMLAVRRTDVTALNDATRGRVLDAGRLGPDAVVAGAGDRQREYRAGDQVLVTANDHRLGLLNGTRAVVTAVDVRQQRMTLTTDEHEQVMVPVEWAGRHLDHGYAMTCHKAQGATVDIALLFGAGGVTREAGYVGLSRGRVANHLYVAEPDGRALAVAAGDDGLDRIAARLAVRRSQTLATRQLPRRPAAAWRLTALAEPAIHRSEGISR